MATFKHISSKNADYGAAEQYLTFEHDEFTTVSYTHLRAHETLLTISYAVFCLKKFFFNDTATTEIYTISSSSAASDVYKRQACIFRNF